MRPIAILSLSLLLHVCSTATLATPCELPDNGTGSVDLPPPCADGYVGYLRMIDGFPPGTTVEGEAVLTDFTSVVQFPGGTLGGEVQQFEATVQWTASGTGALTGFARTLWIPVVCESHTGPRTPGDPVQVFPNDMFRLQGEWFGDPDFCTLRIRAGTDNGLPSPGETTLTRLPSGDFAVDSFFDITYEIEFEGCPGSILEGLAGTTTAVDRYQAGEPYIPPINHNCQLEDDGSGTIDLPPDCPDGYVGYLRMIDGFPPGTTVEGEAVLTDFTSVVQFPGGTLGGEVQQFEATVQWTASGTGALTGFARTLWIPVVCESHTGPRTPGDPVQVFPNDMFRLQGEWFGDPDFCTLRIRAGTDNGLPSPGETTLTRLPSGDFAVDSFFDITYEIEFEGCPGSILEGLAGTTTAVDRYQAGEPYIVAIPDWAPSTPFALHQNTPNPFNPLTTIRYDVPSTGGRVALEIFDMKGRLVRVLVRDFQTEGRKSVVWDGTDDRGRPAASGIYVYALRTGNGILYRRIALIR